MADPVTDLAEDVWVRWPLRVQQMFPSLRGVIGDWYGLALVPPLAVLAPTVVIIVFGLVGAAGLGFDEVFSESLVLMASLIALGAFSGQLGMLGLVSFSLGDFLIGHRTWRMPAWAFNTSLVEQLIRTRLPLIISYLLLAVAVIVIPRVGKNIAIGIGQWRRIPGDLAWLVATPIVILASWLGLRTWAAMAPTLMRPYFVWTGGQPTVEAITAFQTQGSRLVAAGVAATVLRQAVNGLFVYVPSLRQQLVELEARARRSMDAGVGGAAGGADRGAVSGSGSVLESAGRGRMLAADVTSALTASLVLSGILETRLLWFVYFAAFLAIRILRSGTVQLAPLERWKVTAARIPVAVRLGSMWLIAVLYRSTLTNDAIGSYQAMAIMVLAGVVLSFAIFPGQPQMDESHSVPARAAAAV